MIVFLGVEVVWILGSKCVGYYKENILRVILCVFGGGGFFKVWEGGFGLELRF